MNETISLEESFEHSLRNFMNWLEQAKKQPVELCNTWGNYNVAWEIIADLTRDGTTIIAAPCSYLSEEQKRKVQTFLKSLAEIPEFLLDAATSHSANVEAMSDASWIPIRAGASLLLTSLAPLAERNRKYFWA